MFAECCEWLLGSSTRAVRAMGFPRESAGIQRRYARCREWWTDHIKRTRAVILRGMERAQQHRKAVILGAGLVHDIPLSELASRFRQVILVDIVHPWSARRFSRPFRNVVRLTADVGNTIEETYRHAWDFDRPLPHSKPTLFLDDCDVDFTASVNLASQLPCMPMAYLSRQGVHSQETICEYARDLIREHLAYLSQLPGVVALITDVERLKYDMMGRVVERRDLFFGVPPPRSGEEWEWQLAPAPEVHPHFHYYRRVVGIADWK